MFKNWKSTLAFFIFVGIYIYTAIHKGADVIETTGYVALISSLFMMLRNEITTEIVDKVLDNVTKKRD